MNVNLTDSEATRLRVCFFGTYRAGYVRNQVLIAGLRAAGVTVYECHAPLWHSVADRVEQAGGGWRRPQFWWRVARAYWRLWQAHRAAPDYDVMLVGYPGQFDSFLGRLLSRRRGRPMALDILMSLHLIAQERGLTRRSPLSGRLIFALEKAGLHLPDLLFADTAEYETYYRQKYHLPAHRFRRLPLGVDDRVFQPRPAITPAESPIRVIYYGTFIPLHGVPTILQAAARLHGRDDIIFDFYGDGQERPFAEQMAAKLGLTNVHFHGWLDKSALPDAIARSHIVLGVFGTTKQSLCTVQNKIWEGLMMQRPVISGDAPTIRATLEDDCHLLLVERANPQALANAITALAADPARRQRLAAAAFERVQANTVSALGIIARDALLALHQAYASHA